MSFIPRKCLQQVIDALKYEILQLSTRNEIVSVVDVTLPTSRLKHVQQLRKVNRRISHGHISDEPYVICKVQHGGEH